LLRGCECGYIAAGVIAVIAAAGAAYGAYEANEAAQQQASMAKRNAQMQADAEAQAGEARSRQIQYNADKLRKQFLSRGAAAGVEAGQGSLLETESQFDYDVQLSKDFAKYPHELAGASARYQSDLFGFQKKSLASQQIAGTAIAGVTTGASSYSSFVRSLGAGGGGAKPSQYNVGDTGAEYDPTVWR